MHILININQIALEFTYNINAFTDTYGNNNYGFSIIFNSVTENNVRDSSVQGNYVVYNGHPLFDFKVSKFLCVKLIRHICLFHINILLIKLKLLFLKILYKVSYMFYKTLFDVYLYVGYE